MEASFLSVLFLSRQDHPADTQRGCRWDVVDYSDLQSCSKVFAALARCQDLREAGLQVSPVSLRVLARETSAGLHGDREFGLGSG